MPGTTSSLATSWPRAEVTEDEVTGRGIVLDRRTVFVVRDADAAPTRNRPGVRLRDQ